MRPEDWVIELVDEAMAVTGLGRWDVAARAETGMARVAVMEIQPEYEAALLRVDETTTDDRRGRTAVVHEVCHLQHAPLYTALDYVLEMVPEDRRDLARRVMDEADELVVQRWAVAWERALRAGIGGCTRAGCCGIMTSEADGGQEPPADEGDD